MRKNAFQFEKRFLIKHFALLALLSISIANVLATQTATQLGKRTTFHVLDYYRPGMTDAAVIQSAIDAAIASAAPAEVVLENKTYHIDQTLVMNRTHDLTLDGNGAKLIMTKYIMAINVYDCTRTRLTNMTFDYDPLPFSQGEIVKVDPQAKTWDIKIDAGFPWDGAFLETVRKGGAIFFHLMDVRQRMVKEGSYEPSVSKIEVIGDRLLRVTDRSKLFVSAVAPGDVLAIGPWAIFADPKIIAEYPKKYSSFYTIYHWQHSVIHMVNTEACQTDHLTFHAGPAALYEFAGKGGNHHFNNTVTPGPRPEGAAHDRQVSMLLDVFESVSTEKGPLVENWFIERSGDDAIVLFGMYNKIVDSPASGTVLVTPVFRNVLGEGDQVEIRNIDDSVKGVARVTRLRSVNRPELAEMNRKLHEVCTHPFPWTPETFLELTLDKNIPSQPGDRIIALNRRCQGTVIRNNRIRGLRANGMRINGADVLIENNDIEHATMSGIKLSLDRENVLWAATCENIVIRGNRIKSTGLLPIRDTAAVGMHAGIQQMLIGNGNNNRRFFSPYISARNITIENNLIENSAQYGILCANASQVVIRNNDIRDANLMEARTNALGFKPESAIQVAASDHLTIGNNTITPGKYGKKEVGEFKCTAVKITQGAKSEPARAKTKAK
jgi:hypothetical protein